MHVSCILLTQSGAPYMIYNDLPWASHQETRKRQERGCQVNYFFGAAVGVNSPYPTSGTFAWDLIILYRPSTHNILSDTCGHMTKDTCRSLLVFVSGTNQCSFWTSSLGLGATSHLEAGGWSEIWTKHNVLIAHWTRPAIGLKVSSSSFRKTTTCKYVLASRHPLKADVLTLRWVTVTRIAKFLKLGVSF